MQLKPASHYGIYKQANEGAAEVYWGDNGFSSIGLRPFVAYSPGRDQGMTSTPTKAIIASVLNEDYNITFGGSYCFQYVDDIAKVYIRAARSNVKGHRTYNIGGPIVSTVEFVDELICQMPEMNSRISFNDIPLPFPPTVDNSKLMEVIGQLDFTPLLKGIEKSLEIFSEAQRNGLISEETLK